MAVEWRQPTKARLPADWNNVHSSELRYFKWNPLKTLWRERITCWEPRGKKKNLFRNLLIYHEGERNIFFGGQREILLSGHKFLFYFFSQSFRNNSAFICVRGLRHIACGGLARQNGRKRIKMWFIFPFHCPLAMMLSAIAAFLAVFNEKCLQFVINWSQIEKLPRAPHRAR